MLSIEGECLEKSGEMCRYCSVEPLAAAVSADHRYQKCYYAGCVSRTESQHTETSKLYGVLHSALYILKAICCCVREACTLFVYIPAIIPQSILPMMSFPFRALLLMLCIFCAAPSLLGVVQNGKVQSSEKQSGTKYSSAERGVAGQRTTLRHSFPQPLLMQQRRTTKDGLASNTVQALCHDRSGLLWIATTQGLCQAGGNRIWKKELPAGEKFAVLHHGVESCIEDSSGSMWFGTRSGVFRYTPRTGQWKECPLLLHQRTVSQRIVPNYLVKALCCDHSGMVWIGTTAGLFRTDPRRDSCAVGLPELENRGIDHLHEDTSSVLWVGMEGKNVAWYDLRAGSTGSTFHSAEVPQSLGDDLFVHAILDKEGMTISCYRTLQKVLDIPLRVQWTRNSVQKEERLTAKLSALPVLRQICIKGVDTYIMARDGNGYTWLYVNDYGAYRYQSGLYAVHATAEDLPSEPILAGNVTAFLQEPSGVIWVGLRDRGLVMLFPSGMDILSDRSVMGDALTSLSDRRGRLWHGTRTGLFLSDSAPKNSATESGALRWKQIPFPPPHDRLRAVHAVRETLDGHIFCATSEGLLQYDEALHTLRPVPAYIRSVGVEASHLPVKSLMCDSHDRLWLTIPLRGLVCCASDGTVLHQWNEGSATGDIPALPIFALVEDKAENIWIGTFRGLLRWNRQNERLEQHVMDDENTLPDTQQNTPGAPSLPHERLSPSIPVSVIYADTTSTINSSRLLVTVDVLGFAEVLPWRSKSSLSSRTTALQDKFSLYPVAITLPDTRVTQMVRIGSQYWWTSYGNGVYATDTAAWNRNAHPSPRHPIELLPPEAPAAVEAAPPVNQGSLVTARDGSVYLDYFGSLVRVRPSEAQPFHDTPRVTCAGWYRNDSLMASVPAYGDTLHAFSNSSFTLECAILSLLRPERFVLEYRLEGWESAWNRTPNNEVSLLRYSALSPGEYRLWVRPRVEGDSPESAPLFMVSVVVYAPWWQWWYSQVAALVAVVVLLGMVLRTYERAKAQKRLEIVLAQEHHKREQEQRRAEEEREKEQLRRNALEFQLKTLHLQMNPHFIFNTLALIQEQTLEAPEQATASVGIFADLLRQIVIQSDKHLVPMSEELQFIKRYMEIEQMRNEDKIAFHLHLVPAGRWSETLLVPPFILQPFLENAVRHGLRPMLTDEAVVRRDCQLRLSIYKEDTVLRCVIEDNGIGRKASAEVKQQRILYAQQQNTPNYSKHLSIATTKTSERLALLQEVYNLTLVIAYDDLTDEDGTAQGTRVTLSLPVQEYRHRQ